MNRDYYVRVVYEIFDERYKRPSSYLFDKDVANASIRWTALTALLDYIYEDDKSELIDILFSFYKKMLNGRRLSKCKEDRNIFDISLEVAYDAMDIYNSMM